jgi:hypothetical protein
MKKIIYSFPLFVILFLFTFHSASAQDELDQCNVTWTTQSNNSGESMPCGGGDIGLNVWVEKGDLFFYIARSGAFDENNTLLKAGRVRIKLSPNPFEGKDFQQELLLRDGYVLIKASKGKLTSNISIWVNAFQPAINVEINCSQPATTEATFESWRYKDRILNGRENNANSYKWIGKDVTTFKDEIGFEKNTVLFFHQNKPYSVFDITVKQQGLDSVKEQFFNPLKDLIFGGSMSGNNMIAAGETQGTYLNTDYKGWTLKSKSANRSQHLTIYLNTSKSTSIEKWKNELNASIQKSVTDKNAWQNTRNWWHSFWQRSFIFVNGVGANDTSATWQTGRNYQLFRYMLGCNAFGEYPTKFNGGLFTYDPLLVDTAYSFTPDFRNWGGGIHTAQNQRLVYFPMIKNGDFDLLKPQFDFYLRILHNAELRSRIYWQHGGACFTEQMDNFGLPNMAEYGSKRPADFDSGVEYNAWLEYLWDTVLEFCLMMLEEERYTQKDISSHLPFIESCVKFFDEHYQYLARRRGARVLDGNGQLVLFPGSGAETFKMAYNSSSTIAALKTITTRLLELPTKYLTDEQKKYFDGLLKRIPPVTFGSFGGHQTIAPAKIWERIQNEESPQLYPVFPWGMYGVGKPHLDIALNTWKYDTNVIRFRNYVGWKQDNIFAARLGLTDEAARLTSSKLKNSGRRFPAFWGPGFDWTPDHNWGGSGMIGLQEMLMQVDGEKIYLFPAWPKEWDVHFKLHAPYQTTVEAVLKNGKVEKLEVIPESRRKDIINLLNKN